MRENGHVLMSSSSGMSRVVRALLERAEELAAVGSDSQARSAYLAAVAADETGAARRAYAAWLIDQGQPSAARLQWLSALDAAHLRERDDERVACALPLASLASQEGDHAAADRWLQRAVQWQLRAQGMLSGEVLLQLGISAIHRRQLGVARDYLLRGLSRNGAEEGPLLTLHLGIVERLRGDVHAALSRFAEAHRLFLVRRDLEGCAFALINAGHTLADLGRLEEAGTCYQQSGRIFDLLGQSLRARRTRGFQRELVRREAIQSAEPDWN